MSEGDALPEELDVTLGRGPYLFPGTRRRRVAAAIHATVAVAAGAIGLAVGNAGLVLAAVLLALIALFHVVAAWDQRVDQTEALAVAAREVGFPIGHSSAQLGWRGLRSRPSWRILLFSADDPPSVRGLVEVDAVAGEVLGSYTERNPEEWAGG